MCLRGPALWAQGYVRFLISGVGSELRKSPPLPSPLRGFGSLPPRLPTSLFGKVCVSHMHPSVRRPEKRTDSISFSSSGRPLGTRRRLLASYRGTSRPPHVFLLPRSCTRSRGMTSPSLSCPGRPVAAPTAGSTLRSRLARSVAVGSCCHSFMAAVSSG